MIPDLGRWTVLPLSRAMTPAADKLPDWNEADDVPHLEDAHEHSSPSKNLHVKRVEMLNTQKEEESDTARSLATSASSVKFETPSTRLARAHKRICQMLCHV